MEPFATVLPVATPTTDWSTSSHLVVRISSQLTPKHCRVRVKMLAPMAGTGQWVCRHLSYSVSSAYKRLVNTLGSLVGCCGAIPCCIVCPNPYKPVSQGNVGLVTKFGRFYRAVDPGLVKINPLSEKLIQVDVKIQIVGMLNLYITRSSSQPTKILYRGAKADMHD